MDVESILQELLSAREDAIAAILVDESGETVRLERAAPGPVDERLVAAGIALSLKHLKRLSAEAELGAVSGLDLAGPKLAITAVCLPHDYMLALVERGPAVRAVSRRELQVAAGRLDPVIFA